MNTKLFKKIMAVLVVLIMIIPYLTGLINTSLAAENSSGTEWKEYIRQYMSTVPVRPAPVLKDNNVVENWDDFIRSYMSFAYEINGTVQPKWLFQDTREEGKYQNLNCIRSGARQDKTYTKHDLYTLKEKEPEIFNELFKGSNLSDEEAYRNYLHVMWEIENFYLFNDKDTAEDKAKKFNDYNQFIGATSTPYAANDMADIRLWSIATADGSGSLSGETINNISKNEMLVKALQNEMLLGFVVQTYGRPSNTSQIYNVDYNYSTGKFGKYIPVSSAVQNYVNAIVSKFTTKSNSDGYSVENINKYFNSDPQKAKVQLENKGEGEFAVKNEFKAKVTEMNVYLNNEKITNYKIYDANNNEITDCLDKFTNSASSAPFEFKVQFDGMNSGNNNIKVTLNVDYGYIISATLFEPKDSSLEKDKNGNLKGCQYVVNINKDHKTEVVFAEGETTAKIFDLALTKQIVSIENDDPVPFRRLNYIDTEALAAGQSSNARYVMNKSLVHIEAGKKVVYAITVYNEGEVEGYAEEITDYLPEYLDLVPAEESEINEKYGWVADRNNSKIIRTTYLSSNKASNKLTVFNGGFNDSNSHEVQLECIVNENTPNATRIDNRSEISKYCYFADLDDDGVKEAIYADRDGIDRDSRQNSVPTEAGSEGMISKVVTLIEQIIAEKNGYNAYNDDKNKISYQDDDDIERLYVVKDTRKMDLALRKWIEKVDDTTYDREPKQLAEYESRLLLENQIELARRNTLEYDNPKDAISLKVGSLVTYKIAIFNEGTANAYAQKVTDYLPKGLEFVEDNDINKANGWRATKNSDGTTTVTTTKLAEENGEELANGMNSNLIAFPLQTYGFYLEKIDDVYAHKTLEIVCKVTDDIEVGEYLTNRAEITEYGYYTKDGDFVTAKTDDVDRDSKQDTIRFNLKLSDWYETHYKNVVNETTPRTCFPGEEDDDDFETVFVEVVNGEYSIKIKKVSAEDSSKTIEGAKFEIKQSNSNGKAVETQPTNSNGITSLINNALINNNTTDSYTIKETFVPDPYRMYNGEIKLDVAKKLENGTYVIDRANTKVSGENVKLDIVGSVITITVPNETKEFDLALRKFITSVNDSKLEGDASREPKVDAKTLINGDPKKNGEKTATYNHTKDPIYLNPTDIVEYTLRVYNEGELDGYASRVIDDVPAEVTMVAPEYDSNGNPLNENARYGWVMYKEMSEEDKKSEKAAATVLQYKDKYYVETDKAEEAVIISTEYLSLENGRKRMTAESTENPNLIKAFTGSRLYFKDIKVEFIVKPSRDNKTIITNYAQISEHHLKDGTPITDRDSTPNVWNDGEDDQDIENIHINWFDLALYKWVSSTIVTEDGKTKEYASGHTQDNKDAVVNVTIAKDKLDKVVVKFKWTIKVENQGPIAGYATELKDHIPEGLKFVEEDNKEFGWKLEKDGTITTNYLKDTLLQKGDTAELPVILTWVNDSENMGVKVNYAEISEDFNAYGAPDIDSTPDNLKGEPAEDDEDKDEVRLNIQTGSGVIIKYTLITVGVLAMVAVGIVFIKKNVLDKEF